MDFHSLVRKELQALCKKNKIPANMTNVAMADALQALQNVEGLEEFLNPSDSNLSQSPDKNVNGSPDIPRTAARASTRRKPTKQVTESTQPLTRTRRGTRGSAAQGIDQENKDVNVLITPAPAVPGSRRRVPAASSRRKIETQLREAEEDEKSEAQESSDVVETPVVPSNRRRAPATSALRKLETENSVQRVYSTRHSVRLLEKNLGEMSLVENGKSEPVKIDDMSEDMTNNSEISEHSVQFEKEMSDANNTQTVSEVGPEETNDSQVLSDPKPVESVEMERELKVDIKDMNKSDDESKEDNLKSEVADNSGVKVSETIDEAGDEGSDESDIISSEKLEMAIDVDHETVDAKVTEQDTRSEDSLVVKESNDASAEDMDHVSESLSPQHECQNLASKDSELNVTEGDDHSNCDSESESTEGESDSKSESATEGEFDEEIASDENSSECEEDYSDDDAETEEEKDLEAPVLPIGFEKLENNHSGSESIVAEQSDIQVSVENQASTMEIYNTEALVDVYVTEAEEVAMKTNDQSSVETPISMKNMSPDLLISDCEVTLSTVATNSISEDKTSCHADDPMAKAEEMHETLVDVCVMPAHESNMSTELISDSKVSYEIPFQPFAADQLSGQFPRPTQLTPRKSSAIIESTIQKVTDVSDDDVENIDTGNVEVELDKEKAKPDELAGKSLRQLAKMLKEMHIKSNKKHNTDKSATKEHVGKKRIALQALPENCSMAVDEGLKEN
nr:centrosome-associated zinc finger protein CP190 isoform X3 [Quercus suber]